MMPAFTALNVEPDENPEDDVDHTRELQLDEALKLYQNALKLHAQGPNYYEQAAEAYDTLFQSEVFQYPESLINFTDNVSTVESEHSVEEEYLLPAEDGSSTLPQVLYLAYKNHGQFIMDFLRHEIKKHGKDLPVSHIRPQAEAALGQFTQAIIYDESDAELWRRTARVGGLLGSKAIARYCLEAAVEVDDDPALGEVDPANLEEGFAGVQLKELLSSLSDDVALSHPIMLPYKKKELPTRLKKYLDLYPFLQNVEPNVAADADMRPGRDPHSKEDVRAFTWHSLGEALYRLQARDDGLEPEDYAPGGDIVSINMPAQDVEMADSALPRHASISGSIEMETTPTAEVTAEVPAEDQSLIQNGQDASDMKVDENLTLSARKRSQSTAGLPEAIDEEAGAQKRSKRIRKRDTMNGDAAPPAGPNGDTKYLYEKMRDGDPYMFSYIQGILDKFDVQELGSSADVQSVVDSEKMQQSEHDDPRNLAMRDLVAIVLKWDTPYSNAFNTANGLDILGSTGSLKDKGLTAFLDHSKVESLKAQTHAETIGTDGISQLVDSINADSLTVEEAVYRYFKAMCRSYRNSMWPRQLKDINLYLMDSMDPALLALLTEEVREYQMQMDHSAKLDELKEFAQMMLELHLDFYNWIPDRDDNRLLSKLKDRLGRWASVVSDIVHLQPNGSHCEIALRYLWASILIVSITEHMNREHMILCWTEAQQLLQKSHVPRIELYNSAAMGDVSASAADREISRLATMDFFLKLFKENLDPLAVIETLEPVIDDYDYDSASPGNADVELVRSLPAIVRDMRKFLENGSPSLRLYLWQRLREAYHAIDYPTKVFSCHLKCIEIITSYLQSSKYKGLPEETRHNELLGYLKVTNELLVKALTLALNSPSSFEIIDEVHLRSSMKAVASLCHILHVGSLLEDQAAAGMIADNAAVEKGSDKSTEPVATLKAFFTRLSDMVIRSWALLYTLVKEGMAQNEDRFKTVDNDLAEFLAVVHYSLGLRLRCDRSNKIFVKMMKVELLRMKYVDKWEDFLGQVLWDLYGLRLGDKNGVFEIMDHGCEREKLDKRTAVSIVDHITLLANRMSMKDLLRDELRFTIEAMQQPIGPARANPQTSHNLRNISEYLKRSINPLEMVRALKGVAFVNTLPVHTAESSLAGKGWYYLLGMISLSRFRSQKRTAPGGTDDLRAAGGFFRVQLQFDSEYWEAWYGLAQCFDLELDEDVLWSADKLNNDRELLASEQRSAIHCYMMAASTATRSADASLETAEKMSSMYHDFGCRIYGSSRSPFGMDPFRMDNFERHMSGDMGMYKAHAHEELSHYSAWRYAAGLFKRALAERPNNWMSHYMLAKCLWKIISRCSNPDPMHEMKFPNMATLIDTLEEAVRTCPKPRDSRSDPILEPHYKIVSILHKAVIAQRMAPLDAANILQRQRYPIRKGEAIVINDKDSWDGFVFDYVRHLRSLDKSNWQHRFISRSAHLLFERQPPSYEGALAAQNQMSGFVTKTMVVNAWKTEMERAGRHFVYTSAYVRFMAHLLSLTQDKAGLEALAKRVRKKPAEFYRFNEVWTECCVVYCRLIRHMGNIGLNQDELIKSIPAEDFEAIMVALERWVDDPATSHPVYDVLREALELKKLNASLMKALLIDDLLCDIYCKLLMDVGCRLPREPPKPVAAPQQSPKHESSRQGPMSMSSLVNDLGGASMPGPAVAEKDNVAAKPKAKIPGRREILRRAEALVNRANEGKEKDKEKEKEGEKDKDKDKADGRAAPSTILEMLGVGQGAADGRAAGGDEMRDKEGDIAQGPGEGYEEEDEHGEEEKDGADEDRGGDGDGDGEHGAFDQEGDHDQEGDQESARGSVHDSADDENENDGSDGQEMEDVRPGPPPVQRWKSTSHGGDGDAMPIDE